MRTTRARTMLAMAGATVGVATVLTPSAGQAAPAPPAAPEPLTLNLSSNEFGTTSTIGDTVTQKAYDELNSDHKYEIGTNCNFYSGVFDVGSYCGVSGYRAQPWCADFVKFVWKNANVLDWQQLHSEAGDPARWGMNHGSWYWGTGGLQPGDTVVYDADGDPTGGPDGGAAHTGIYVGWVNGRQMVISGNYSNQVYKHELHAVSEPVRGYARPKPA